MTAEAPAVLGTDSMGREILDVTKTANRTGHMRAERVDRLALVLTKLDGHVKRFDGKKATYMLEDMTLCVDGDDELAAVKGNDHTYWTEGELKPFLKDGKPLFSFLTVL